MISASVRSGYVAANRLHIGPPSDTPSSTARREPTASITARTSSIRCSSVGSSAIRIGQAGAALVEQDQPGEAGEPPQKPRERRLVPEVLEMRHPAHHEHQIDRPVPST